MSVQSQETVPGHLQPAWVARCPSCGRGFEWWRRQADNPAPDAGTQCPDCTSGTLTWKVWQA